MHILSPLTNIIMSAKAEILQAIAAERDQYLAAIEAALSKQGISDADKADILTAVRGIVPDATPAEGKHNVRLSASTSGNEEMILSLVNNGADDAQAAALRALFDGVLAAAEVAPADKGPSVTTTFSFSDNGETVPGVATTLLQKAYADRYLGQAIVAIAEAQINAIENPTAE